MVAEDFLQDPQIRGWLDGIEPAGTLKISASSPSAPGFSRVARSRVGSIAG